MSSVQEVSKMMIIPLNHGKQTIIDIEDYDKIKHLNLWAFNCKNERWYVCYCNDEHKNTFLPRLLLDTTNEVDHINGDGLDNRKSNLRIVTRSQNLQNSRKPRRIKGCSSKYKGVCWDKLTKKWRAQITFNYHVKYIGLFENEVEAAEAYDKVALEMFGEYAKPNFYVYMVKALV
jgi:hypothetical protein